MPSDFSIYSKIPIKERGSFAFLSAHLDTFTEQGEPILPSHLSCSGIRTPAGPSNLIREADVLQTHLAGRGSVLA